MNQPADHPSAEIIEMRRLARAMRFALAAIVLVISWFLFRATQAIPGFETFSKNLLGGKPLPSLTMLVFRAGPFLMVVSYLVPILAVAALLLKRVTVSYYLLGALTAIAVVQCVLVYHALSLPLLEMVSQIGGQ